MEYFEDNEVMCCLKLFLFSGCIQRFLQKLQDCDYITDENSNLIQFCQNLERVFIYGLISVQNAFGFTKSVDPWNWLEKLAFSKDSSISFSFINSVEAVKRYQSILTNTGKLRLLIRNCLTSKSLHVPVEYLVSFYNSIR